MRASSSGKLSADACSKVIASVCVEKLCAMHAFWRTKRAMSIVRGCLDHGACLPDERGVYEARRRWGAAR
jgi:hypothetical protein